MSAFLALGSVAVLIGLALLAISIRHHGERQPKHVAMLIGGMMLAAFGLVLAGFSLAWQATAPLDLNATEAQ